VTSSNNTASTVAYLLLVFCWSFAGLSADSGSGCGGRLNERAALATSQFSAARRIQYCAGAKVPKWLSLFYSRKIFKSYLQSLS
ncbi:hypothetical protein N9H91_04480, partial [Pseudomonadales bacterium]|nr:hypothetical protein [Pseudomonadales bacterium]